MKWIKYQIVQSTVDEEDILVNKKVGYSEANLAIAETEAYNGEYEIVEDSESFEKEPLAIEFGGTGAKNAEDAKRNLGIDAGGGVFIAEYGKTSSEELDVAYAAGKLLVCKMNMGTDEQPWFMDIPLNNAVDGLYVFNLCTSSFEINIQVSMDRWIHEYNYHFSHTHEKSEITDFPTSMTPTAHNQAASTITAGTFAGRVQGNVSAMATLANAQFRDIKAGTTDLTAGESYLATGTLYFVYE